MCQSIRIIRSGDIIANHASLGCSRCPTNWHPTSDGLRRTPGTPRVCRGNEANTQLCAARWVEVIGQTKLSRTPRGRLVDGQARNEMINATFGRINRYPAYRRPGGTGAIERLTDDKIICFTSTAKATVSPGNIDRPRPINLG